MGGYSTSGTDKREDSLEKASVIYFGVSRHLIRHWNHQRNHSHRVNSLRSKLSRPSGDLCRFTARGDFGEAENKSHTFLHTWEFVEAHTVQENEPNEAKTVVTLVCRNLQRARPQ